MSDTYIWSLAALSAFGLVLAVCAVGLAENWLSRNPGTLRERAHLLADALDRRMALPEGDGKHRVPRTGVTT